MLKLQLARYRHELRTPLTAASLYAQMMKIKLQSNQEMSKEDMIKQLDSILDQMKKVNEVISKGEDDEIYTKESIAEHLS